MQAICDPSRWPWISCRVAGKLTGLSLGDCILVASSDRASAVQAKSENKLLQVRGNAGTHDLQLGQDTLRALQRAASLDAEVAVPRYDKSQHGGRGDRAPRSAWPCVKAPIDIILFEGWMLGFSPVADEEVEKVRPGPSFALEAW